MAERISKKELFRRVEAWFQETMPTAETELNYSNTYELLVAVILSAQCTDKRVNTVTPALFDVFPTVETLAVASVDAVFEQIRSVSYPNSKAKYLIGAAQQIVERFGSEVPMGMDELTSLLGVGRKTANVIRAVAFNLPSMPVDTHVFRVSNRIGLTTQSKSPLETERTLVRYFPKQILTLAHHWLILHGRYVCAAQRPRCEACGLQELCRHYQKEKKR